MVGIKGSGHLGEVSRRLLALGMVFSSGKKRTGDRWGCCLQIEELRLWKVIWPGREYMEEEAKWVLG